MKAIIVLLATAVAFACGAPHPSLKFITKNVHCLHRRTLSMEVYVKDLKRNKTDSCEDVFFCQAERILKSNVKVLQELHECHVHKLLRDLHQYHNGVNCSVPPEGDEILLHCFLDEVLKCAKRVYAKRHSS